MQAVVFGGLLVPCLITSQLHSTTNIFGVALSHSSRLCEPQCAQVTRAVEGQGTAGGEAYLN